MLVEELFLMFALFVFLCVVMSPTIRAFQIDHEHKWLIALVNITLGWSVIGWVGCWAFLCLYND